MSYIFVSVKIFLSIVGDLKIHCFLFDEVKMCVKILPKCPNSLKKISPSMKKENKKHF